MNEIEKFKLKLCVEGGLKKLELKILYRLNKFLYNKIHKQETDEGYRCLLSNLLSEVQGEISRRRKENLL